MKDPLYNLLAPIAEEPLKVKYEKRTYIVNANKLVSMIDDHLSENDKVNIYNDLQTIYNREGQIKEYIHKIIIGLISFTE